jgi:CheY-like chemotaxis protein
MQPVPEILMVDDNPADIALVREAIAEGKRRCKVHSVEDGMEAMSFLRREGRYTGSVRPDLVVLDLNLPKKDGRTVLAEVKDSPELRGIPVVIFSTSQAGADVVSCYELGANCYVSKPMHLAGFFGAIHSIEEFWFGLAILPKKGD